MKRIPKREARNAHQEGERLACLAALKLRNSLLLVALLGMTLGTTAPAAPEVRLITLDPGHFHAGLVQKFMYPQVSPLVHVYAPPGPDLQDHLKRIEGFNTRPEQPTHWREEVYAGPDFLERMLRDKAGNVVVLAGNNARKTEYIDRAVAAGYHVLADKPMAITPDGFKLLTQAFAQAKRHRVLLYDIMTERYEITSILQRELARIPAVFGRLERGAPNHPAVVMESVHHFYKEVAGKPLTRPAWFFDVRQQGEAIQDVGTHLVDLVQWECFPERALSWEKDIRVLSARHWPTRLSADQFSRVTGGESYPDFLKPDVAPDGNLEILQNGEVTYTVRGVHVKVSALWHFEAPPGGADTHYAMLRGTRAVLTIKQGPEQRFRPALYVQPAPAASSGFEHSLHAAIEKLCATWPGLQIQAVGNAWEVTIPDKYRVGHEAHFAQVTERYLGFLTAGRMPSWEVPGMLAKYYTTSTAYRLMTSR